MHLDLHPQAPRSAHNPLRRHRQHHSLLEDPQAHHPNSLQQTHLGLAQVPDNRRLLLCSRVSDLISGAAPLKHLQERLVHLHRRRQPQVVTIPSLLWELPLLVPA